MQPTSAGMQLEVYLSGCRGKSKGRISQTPWGVPTKGYRTRDNPRTDQYIRLSRHKVRAGR